MTDAAPSSRSAAIAPALIGVFMVALTIAIVRAPVAEPPWLAALLRLFVGAVLGGIGVGCLVLATRIALGLDRAERGLPSVLRTFCPACGEPTEPRAVVCDRCAHPLLERERRWTTEPVSLLAIAFLAVLGVGLASLGLALILQPHLDGVGGWEALGLGALGLLLLIVGGAFVYGGAAMLVARLRDGREWTYRAQLRSVERVEEASAVARVGRHGVRAKGERRAVRAIAEHSHALGRLPPQLRAFVDAVVASIDAGVMRAIDRESDAWTRHDASLERRASRELVLRALEQPVPPALRAIYAALAPHAIDDVEARALWRAVAATPDIQRILASAPPCADTPLAQALARAVEHGLAN